MENIYYAHPLSIYNCDQEAADLALLRKLFPQVLNPNGTYFEEGYKRAGMAFFTEEVLPTCTGTVFRSFPDGTIPAGVAKEVDYFLTRNLPVYEITDTGLIPCPSDFTSRVLSVVDTRAKLAILGRGKPAPIAA